MRKRNRSPFKKGSMSELLNNVPPNGCMLIFNANHRSVRSKASDKQYLLAFKIDDKIVGRNAKGKDAVCDMYIVWDKGE